MTRFISRLSTISIGREDPASYGTKSILMQDFPVQEFTVDNTKEVLLNDQGFGLIADNAIGSKSGKTASEFTITGICSEGLFGQMLKAAFGTVAFSVDTPVASANQHTFTVANTNSHPSYTIAYKDSIQVRMITGAMLSKLEIKIVAGEWVTYTATFSGQTAVVTTETIAPAAETYFTAAESVCKIGANVAALAAAAAVTLESGTLTIEKPLEVHYVWGSNDVEQISNKQFTVTGSFEMLFETAAHSTAFESHTIQAMSITLTTTEFVTGTTPFSLAITIPQFHIASWSSPKALNDLVKQSFEIKAEYDTVTSAMISAVLVNDTATDVY